MTILCRNEYGFTLVMNEVWPVDAEKHFSLDVTWSETKMLEVILVE